MAFTIAKLQYGLAMEEAQVFSVFCKSSGATLELAPEIRVKTEKLARQIRERLAALGLLDAHGVEKKVLALAQGDGDGGRTAREVVDLAWRVVRLNLPLIRFLADRYSSFLESSSADTDDALQEACFATFRAALKYNPAKGKFSYYLRPWIRQFFVDKRTHDELPIRVPRHIREFLTKRENRLDGRNDLKEHEFRALLALVGKEIRFDASYVEDGESVLSEIFPEKDSPTPEEIVSKAEAIGLVRKLLGEFLLQFKEREREVICLRFGFKGGRPHTLQEIADRLGVTKERVRQIEKKAITKLKARFFRKVRDNQELKRVFYDLLTGNF